MTLRSVICYFHCSTVGKPSGGSGVSIFTYPPPMLMSSLLFSSNNLSNILRLTFIASLLSSRVESQNYFPTTRAKVACACSLQILQSLQLELRMSFSKNHIYKICIREAQSILIINCYAEIILSKLIQFPQLLWGHFEQLKPFKVLPCYLRLQIQFCLYNEAIFF